MRRTLSMFIGLLLTGLLLTAANPASRPAPIRFLALGDSYTIGQSVMPTQRWPVQLAAALRAGGIDIDAPTIIARTGWTTADLSAAMDHADLHGPYDLVGLLIGVNNQFQGRSPDEYRDQFAALLARAITLAGNQPSRVLVLSIPDWGVTPFARQMGADPATVGGEIDHFNAINKELTAKAGAVYIDITPISRQRRDLVAEDGLHPSGEMYAKWVEATLPAARKAIQP